METRFDELKGQFETLQDIDISHDELGTANGYHAAEESKNSTCLFCLELIGRIERLGEYINSSIVDDGYTNLKSTADHFNAFKDQIEQTVSQGVHNNNFPNQRNSQLQQFEAHSLAIKKNTSQLEMALRLVELEQKVGNDEKLSEISEKLSNELARAKKASEEAESISETLRNKAAEKGVSTAKGAFQDLSTEHQSRERLWFIAFVISCIAFISIIIYIFVHESALDKPVEVIFEIFKRLLLLSAAGLAIKITVSKYNLERNLRIIYDHRSSTLKQFEIFEKAIANDVEAKNQLRLDVAKYVFSDPETGYRSTGTSNDININPVLKTVEKVVSK